MTTSLITHSDCLDHISPEGHPECAERLERVLGASEDVEFDNLLRIDAPLAIYDQLKLVHDENHFQNISNNFPIAGNAFIDGDTYLSAGSEKAALRATGAVCQAIDRIIEGDIRNAFCAVRPPGHYAEPDHAMGFCLFNSAAIGAMYARMHHFMHGVAIIHIDVYHGNCTQTVAEKTKGLFYGSIHQSPLYPRTGHIHDQGNGVIVNIPLAAGSGSNAFCRAFESRILPELDEFKPDLLIVSARFDAHTLDPLADLNLEVDDYYWSTRELMKIAKSHAKDRVVSTIEGGYNLGII